MRQDGECYTPRVIKNTICAAGARRLEIWTASSSISTATHVVCFHRFRGHGEIDSGGGKGISQLQARDTPTVTCLDDQCNRPTSPFLAGKSCQRLSAGLDRDRAWHISMGRRRYVSILIGTIGGMRWTDPERGKRGERRSLNSACNPPSPHTKRRASPSDKRAVQLNYRSGTPTTRSSELTALI
jgi:hypothetical protein